MQQLDHQELHTAGEAGQDPLKSYLTSKGVSYDVQETENAPTEIVFTASLVVYTFLYDGDTLLATNPAL